MPSNRIIASAPNFTSVFVTNFDKISANNPSNSNLETCENNCNEHQQDSSASNHTGDNLMGTSSIKNSPLNYIVNNSSISDNSVENNNNAFNEQISSNVNEDRDLLINQESL